MEIELRTVIAASLFAAEMNAVPAGVNIHPWGAQESYQGLPAFFGELNRETGRRGHGADDRNLRGQRFLHDLEGRPPAHHEDVLIEGEEVVQNAVTNDLVDSVVPPDVLAGNE